MPALIAHHIFGQDAVARIPEGLVEGQEELLAFLLGNQGPDPCFTHVLGKPATTAAVRKLGKEMHRSHISEALFTARDAIAHLPVSDSRVGRAFVLGLVGHYALDSITHPIVYAGQKELAALRDDLADAERELHGLIESELDTWVLWEKRSQDVVDFSPSTALGRTDTINRVSGAVISAVALKVFGISIPSAGFPAAVRDYEIYLCAINNYDSLGSVVISSIETLVRTHSLTRAMAYRSNPTHECPSANLDHNDWIHPWTGTASTASFADLYDEALEKYPRMAEALVRGDRATFDRLSAGLSYEGKPGA